MGILVHSCCGPCLTAVAEYLIGRGYDIVPFWYNPNVMPYREYKKRLSAFKEVCASLKLEPIIVDEYDLDRLLHEVLIPVDNRCAGCYEIRLNRAAATAAERGMDGFTSTLLQSPYQQHLVIAGVGENAGEGLGIPFIYEDFRDLYSRSKEMTREMGIYSQGYCGCIYSEEERYRKR